MKRLVPDIIKESVKAETMTELAGKNPPVKLLDLRSPEYGNDPNELIKHRFLYRGGILVMTGPTGAGKSSFTMQWSVSMAGGADLFGLRLGDLYRGKGLRVLVIQAENDEGDLAEQRDGVLSVIDDDVLERATEKLQFVTMPDASGEAFSIRLKAHCEIHRPDIVFIDPVFSFLGGDNNAQKDVSNWVRNLILPILMDYKCAAVLIHHNNKPQKDEVKSGAYTMAGSAEWANAARAVLSLEPIADGVYALRAEKRGDRLGWKDEDGNSVKVRHIAYHGGEDHNGRPVIAWRNAKETEIPQPSTGRGRNKGLTALQVYGLIKGQVMVPSEEFKKQVALETGAGISTVKNQISECIALGKITKTKLGRNVHYSDASAKHKKN